MVVHMYMYLPHLHGNISMFVIEDESSLCLPVDLLCTIHLWLVSECLCLEGYQSLLLILWAS